MWWGLVCLKFGTSKSGRVYSCQSFAPDILLHHIAIMTKTMPTVYIVLIRLSTIVIRNAIWDRENLGNVITTWYWCKLSGAKRRQLYTRPAFKLPNFRHTESPALQILFLDAKRLVSIKNRLHKLLNYKYIMSSILSTYALNIEYIYASAKQR